VVQLYPALRTPGEEQETERQRIFAQRDIAVRTVARKLPAIDGLRALAAKAASKRLWPPRYSNGSDTAQQTDPRPYR
jgi:hypothetical protein